MSETEVKSAAAPITEGKRISVPPASSAATSFAAPSPDALLSPVDSGFASRASGSVRESQSQFSEVTLDDNTRFSTVPLSPSLQEPLEENDDESGFESAPDEPLSEINLEATPIAERPAVSLASLPLDVSSTSRPSSGSSSKAIHRKSTSHGTLHADDDPTLQLSEITLDGAGTSQRRSREGAQLLQDGFSRVQQGQQTEGSELTTDWDFWGGVMADYQGYAHDHPDELARAIERGIPNTLRGMVWQLMSASKDPELEALYLSLLKDPCSHEKAIMRDLGRTFPHHDFFTDGQGIGQENLFNVLKAYSLYDPEVGYCQGLPFVVAVLLLNMPDEEAFGQLVRLMYTYDLRGHFLPEMPKLQLRLFQFERLVEEMLPVLHVHLLRQGIKSSMFCSQWFLTLFSYRFPLDIVFRIFDNCLAKGIEAIFNFSLALLMKNEEALLSMKFDQILNFLKSRVLEKYIVEPILPSEGDSIPRDVTYKVDEFVQDALNVKIMHFALDSYANEYEEMVRVRDAHQMEVDLLRNQNRTLTAQVRSLEDNLAKLNQDHVDLVKDLVNSRMEYEELEGELVRYKLLYAEAVHQTEDALSSHRLSAMSNGSHGKSRLS